MDIKIVKFHKNKQYTSVLLYVNDTSEKKMKGEEFCLQEMIDKSLY